MAAKKYIIDRGCKLCDACYWACPQKAVYAKDDRCHIDQAKCIGCGICYQNCANEAISIHEENDKISSTGETV
ncbi:MAG: 4Fe-4S binding protein [Spirochaetes bacterium]|nr:4Fe-4S binding protein [Spirochaetota bacterium]